MTTPTTRRRRRRRRRRKRGGLGRVSQAPTASVLRATGATPAGSQDSPTNSKKQALLAPLAALAVRSSSPTAAESTAPILPGRRRSVLGRRALCVTADSPSYPERHRALARADCRRFRASRTKSSTPTRWRARITAPIPRTGAISARHELYTHLSAIARERGIPTIADGSNADDRGDYRPGRQAAREFGVVSPLDAVGLTKAEIRDAVAPRRAADLGRAGVGVPVVAHSVFQRSDRRQAANDRAGGGGAAGARLSRLPRPSPWRRPIRSRGSRSAATRWPARSSRRSPTPSIVELRALGYRHVTLDLRGYRLGSLNDALRLRQI